MDLVEPEDEFNVRSCVRGYHVYCTVWTPVLDEELECMRDSANIMERYSVGTFKRNVLVGHLPKKMSTLASLFIRRGGTITCKITSARKRHSSDLPQGGLEIPCVLIYSGKKRRLIN